MRKRSLTWAKDTADQTLAKEFGKLLKALPINERKGLGLYTLEMDFQVGTSVKVALCAIALWIIGSDAVIRMTRSFA